MGKTRKDRRDRDDLYNNERGSKRKRNRIKKRRRNNEDWLQYKNMSTDEIIDDYMVQDD